MDELTNHAQKMLKIVNDRGNFYRYEDDEICDIADAVYRLIIRLQVLEKGMADMRGEQNDRKRKGYCDGLYRYKYA